MAEVKAEFPIGKTQWAKWNDVQRMEFNDACGQGLSPAQAIAHVNSIDWVKVKDFFPEEPVEAPKAAPNHKPRIIKRKQGK